jgi:hypothetical protein
MFDRFSFPLSDLCITSEIKQKAMGLSKMLWLRLVTGTDTEKNIYQDLKNTLNDNHDSNITIGSIYFYRMKTSLTGQEIISLNKYLRYEDRIRALAQ